MHLFLFVFVPKAVASLLMDPVDTNRGRRDDTGLSQEHLKKLVNYNCDTTQNLM